jgi:diguanylate cyclase (GGDEF)-like protein
MSAQPARGALAPFIGADIVFRALRALGSTASSIEPHSFALLDLDGLGEVNAQHGRAVGDEVLRRTAAILQQWTRPPWMSGYWAGDQFVILLPRTNADTAIANTQTLLAMVSAASSGLPDGLRLSASIGGTTWAASSIRGSELVGRAAMALCEAKQCRGRVDWR